MKIDKYNMPDKLYYHKEHTYAKIEDDLVIVGVTDFAQKLAGEIVLVELSDEGDEVDQNDPFGTMSSGKWTGPIYAPVSGEIVEVNEELEDEPKLVNDDPYGEGWLIKIEPSDLEDELRKLVKGGTDKFKAWFTKEIKDRAK